MEQRHMKSFEEFHTSQKRLRGWDVAIQKHETQNNIKTIKSKTQQEQEEDDNNITLSSSKVDYKNDSIQTSFSRHNIGHLLETFEIQLFIVLLIYFDLIICTISYIIENDAGTIMNHNSMTKIEKVIDNDSMVVRFLSSIASFTIICFVIELVGLLYSFGMKFFTHYGYCLDLLIVTFNVWNNVIEGGVGVGGVIGVDLLFPSQYLGFLRVWRIVRLVYMMVSNVESQHVNTKSQLVSMDQKVKDQELEYKHLQVTVQNEVGLRKEVEKALAAYKDEIETLREALRIAAMDVAMTVKGGVDVIGDGSVGIEEKTMGIDEDGNNENNDDEFFDGNED